MYQLYLPKYLGVNPDTGEAQYALIQPDEEGNTVTTDYAVASENRFATGDILPKVYGGFGTSLKVYGFDFSISFAYQLGGRMIDNTYADLMSDEAMGHALHVDMLNAWTPENRNTDVPRMNANNVYTTYTSDRWLTSSNYRACKTSLSVILCRRSGRASYREGVRLFFVADNVALWTARKGFDPRQGYVSTDNVYSPIRTISGGISLDF